jgi:flagellin-like hook-associated protein FlgL
MQNPSSPNPTIIKSSVYRCLLIDTIKEMIKLCRQLDKSSSPVVTQELNGIEVYIEQTSNVDLIMRDLRRAQKHYIIGPVGPHPAETLTEQELASDTETEAENIKKAKKANAAYMAKAQVKRDAFDAKMLTAPEIEIVNIEAWQSTKDKSPDGYCDGIVAYAEWWARLMQVEIANGKQLADIADAASHEADIEGITGFMYGAAVLILSKVWKHGEDLRRWHNLKTQIRNEGEIANESGGTFTIQAVDGDAMKLDPDAFVPTEDDETAVEDAIKVDLGVELEAADPEAWADLTPAEQEDAIQDAFDALTEDDLETREAAKLEDLKTLEATAMIQPGGLFDVVDGLISTALNQFGASMQYVENQITYNAKKVDAMNDGLGALVDSDLAKESSKLQALQTRQQLGIQTLGIANQGPQVLLSLFR